MKQLMSCLIVATGFLAIVSIANSKSTQTTNRSPEEPTIIVSYEFTSHTCTLLDPEPGFKAPLVPNEDLHLRQNMGLGLRIENIIIEEKDESLIEVAVNTENGNSIRIVQSQEDFRNNSSVNVESIELQWLDSPNSERLVKVELVDQEVDEEFIDLTFKATNISNGCLEFLSIFQGTIREHQVDQLNISISDTKHH